MGVSKKFLNFQNVVDAIDKVLKLTENELQPFVVKKVKKQAAFVANSFDAKF